MQTRTIVVILVAAVFYAAALWWGGWRHEAVEMRKAQQVYLNHDDGGLKQIKRF